VRLPSQSIVGYGSAHLSSWLCGRLRLGESWFQKVQKTPISMQKAGYGGAYPTFQLTWMHKIGLRLRLTQAKRETISQE
jgi:hypothetical protein